MNQFSQKTHETLEHAGWKSDYITDTQNWQMDLEKEGYHVFSSVIDFLHHFGGLYIKNFRDRSPQAPLTFDFDVSRAMRSVPRERIAYLYESRISSPLCVIGQAHEDHMILMMDATGKVYGGYDEFMALIGNTGEEAIENLCTGNGIQEIPE